MATMVNIYESYGDKSARERAELIYSNYSSFQEIIEDCKMRLIYEIKAEKERKRSNHKDELGLRIQNLGNYSNPTADEAVLDVMLEGAINGLNSAEDALSDPALVQEFKQREYVIVMMADEYASFIRHLHALSVKEQEIIIPLLKQEKDYYTLALKLMVWRCGCVRKLNNLRNNLSIIKLRIFHSNAKSLKMS